jgi:RNA polymerase sigma factor (sigma-70 family)
LQFYDDDILMIKVKKGDLDSLSPLFERYNVKMYNFFLRNCHDQELSMDLTQDLFQRIITYRHTYQEGANFKTWIYRMAKNLNIDYYRKNHKWNMVYDTTEDLGSDEKLITEEIVYDEEKQQLFKAIERLSIEQRELIELSRFQDLKYSEISEITGDSIANIKVKVHRAIKKLKEVYYDE